MTIFKKATLATALAASALTAASPAMARPYYDNYHNHGDSTGAAVAGGIIGLALGAIIASSANNHHGHDYDYRQRGWEYRDGYYWDRQGHRYDSQGRRYDDNYYARRGYDGGYANRGYYEDRGYRGY